MGLPVGVGVSGRQRQCIHPVVHPAVYICMYRYLVLDYVAGGELFDYLVKRVRLPEREVCVCVHVCVCVCVCVCVSVCVCVCV